MTYRPDPGFDWTRISRSVPSARQMREAGVDPGPLAGVSVRLARSGSGAKWHVVPPEKSWRQCQHAERLSAGDPVALLEVDWQTVCRRCVGVATGSWNEPERAWARLVNLLLQAQAWVKALEAATVAMTWPSFARWRAADPFSDDEGRWRAALVDYAQSGTPALRLHASGVWTAAARRAQQAFDAAFDAAMQGTADLAAHARHVVARFDGDGGIGEESRLIAALAADHEFGYLVDVWALASTAWRVALERSGKVEVARTAMQQVVEDRYRTMPARDVTLLPEATLSSADFDHPGAWADAEFGALRHRIVAGWAQRQAEALRTVAGASAAGGERLVAVSNWPPVDPRDTDLTYLVQFPVVLRAVTTPALLHRYRGHGEDPGDARVLTVLRVPNAAGEHARVGGRAARRRWIRVSADGGVSATDAVKLVSDVAVLIDRHVGGEAHDADTAAVLAARVDAAARCRHRVLPVRLHDVADTRAAGDRKREIRDAWRTGLRPWIGPVPNVPAVLPGFEGPAGLRDLLTGSYSPGDRPLGLTVYSAIAGEAVTITVLADHVDEHAVWVRGIHDQVPVVVPLRHVVAVAPA